MMAGPNSRQQRVRKAFLYTALSFLAVGVLLVIVVHEGSVQFVGALAITIGIGLLASWIYADRQQTWR